MLWLIPWIFIFGSLAVLWWLLRPQLRCPECDSRECGLVSKEPLGMRESSFHSGGEGGGYTAVQMAYRVRYRCNECQASWTDTITETN